MAIYLKRPNSNYDVRLGVFDRQTLVTTMSSSTVISILPQTVRAVITGSGHRVISTGFDYLFNGNASEYLFNSTIFKWYPNLTQINPKLSRLNLKL